MSILINADDFGLSKETNDAISYSFEMGYIDRATLLVNMPDTDSAVEIAKEKGFFDKIGLHINLVEGSPLSSLIKDTSLCDSQGNFNGSVMKGRNRFHLDSKTKKAVKEEIEFQMAKYKQYGFPLMHIDSHQHSHTNISILPIVLELAREKHFSSIRLSRNIPKEQIPFVKYIIKGIINRQILMFNAAQKMNQVTRFGSISDVETELEKQINTDSIGIEMMVHPIMNNNELMDAFSDERLPMLCNKYSCLQKDNR